MVRNERAFLNMLNDPEDPHHSDRGRRQLTANLLAAIRHSEPAIFAYFDIVHDHIMRLRFDKTILLQELVFTGAPRLIQVSLTNPTHQATLSAQLTPTPPPLRVGQPSGQCQGT